MLLQVHDEIVLELAPGEREQVEELVRREMASAVDLPGSPRRLGRRRPGLGVGGALRTACGRARFHEPRSASAVPWRGPPVGDPRARA
ncbi:hypothetical protein STENM223S_08482 [Streptomyces tendae]